MKKQIFLHKGERFSPNGAAQFAKDVVKVGRWVHPITKQEVVFTQERILNLAKNTERYLANGNRIPFPKGHTTDPTKNLGYWPGPFLPFRDSLVGVVEPKDPVALEAMKAGTLDAVSVCIEFGIKDAKENAYDEVITHVCATSYPILDGQKGFVALSLLGSEDVHISEELAGTLPEGDKPHSKEVQMDPKKVALALGLPEETPENEIFKTAVNARKVSDDLKASQEANKGLETKLSKLTAQFAGLGLKLDGETLSRVPALELDVTPKDTDSDETKTLKAEIASKRQSEAMARANANKAFVTKLATDLKVEPALTSLMEEVLSVKGELEALTLSTDGKGLSVKKLEDFPGKLKTLLEKIVNRKPVTGGGVVQLGADRRKDEESLDAKGLEDLGSTLAGLVQPKKETAAAK